MASAFTISPPSRWARERARSDLPLAVGPTIAMTDTSAVSQMRGHADTRSPGYEVTQRVGLPDTRSPRYEVCQMRSRLLVRQVRAWVPYDAPEVATGGMFVVVGAVPACSFELEAPDVVVPALVELIAEVEPGRVDAMATAPTALAAPAPRVIADTQASARLRACCRAGRGAGELVMLLRSQGRGCGTSRCSLSMPLRSSARLCCRCVLPLNHLCIGPASGRVMTPARDGPADTVGRPCPEHLADPFACCCGHQHRPELGSAGPQLITEVGIELSQPTRL